MDDFDMEGALLRDTLDKLGAINKWLGGNSITIHGVEQFLKHKPKTKTYHIVDLGCGHGDMLRRIAKWGRKQGFKLELTGVDANADAIAYGKTCSANFPEIHYVQTDVFSAQFAQQTFDIALATLFLHHFSNTELNKLLKQLKTQTRLGIVVNDLHRHQMAYGLFKLLSITITNRMIREDGLTSILRAFKRNDLENLSQNLQLQATIKWRWAFRYQWLINTSTHKI